MSAPRLSFDALKNEARDHDTLQRHFDDPEQAKAVKNDLRTDPSRTLIFVKIDGKTVVHVTALAVTTPAGIIAELCARKLLGRSWDGTLQHEGRALSDWTRPLDALGIGRDSTILLRDSTIIRLRGGCPLQLATQAVDAQPRPDDGIELPSVSEQNIADAAKPAEQGPPFVLQRSREVFKLDAHKVRYTACPTPLDLKDLEAMLSHESLSQIAGDLLIGHAGGLQRSEVVLQLVEVIKSAAGVHKRMAEDRIAQNGLELKNLRRQPRVSPSYVEEEGAEGDIEEEDAESDNWSVSCMSAATTEAGTDVEDEGVESDDDDGQRTWMSWPYS